MFGPAQSCNFIKLKVYEKKTQFINLNEILLKYIVITSLENFILTNQSKSSTHLKLCFMKIAHYRTYK